jgi:hypothetical protein
MNGGFRCDVEQTGDADWEIDCRRRDELVVGYAGE